MIDEKNLIRRKGSFKCVSGAVRYFSALLLAGGLMMALLFVLSLINFGEDINQLIIRAGAVCFVMEGAFAAIRIILSLGDDYTYEAGDTDFVVTDRYGDKTYFYYSDLTSVNYTAITENSSIRGYVVEIATGMRVVKYRFRFGPNAEKFSTAATPFYCLEVNAGLREPEDIPEDSEAIMAQFERMQRHQEVEKKKTTRAERESRMLESIQNDNKPIGMKPDDYIVTKSPIITEPSETSGTSETSESAEQEEQHE